MQMVRGLELIILLFSKRECSSALYTVETTSPYPKVSLSIGREKANKRFSTSSFHLPTLDPVLPWLSSKQKLGAPSSVHLILFVGWVGVHGAFLSYGVSPPVFCEIVGGSFFHLKISWLSKLWIFHWVRGLRLIYMMFRRGVVAL